MKLALAVFKFFASLRFAIFLLTALALVFALGTFVESAHGTEAAKLLVYQTPWLTLLLILLALNVAGAALDRLPWQRKHVGFVVTHAGILVLLAGSLVTRAYGIEGQMAIQEGETVNRMILSQPVLQLFSESRGTVRVISLPEKAFAWQGRKNIFSVGAIHQLVERRSAAGSSGAERSARHELPLQAFLLRYLPKASRREDVEPAIEGPPALRVVLESSFMKSGHWLVLDDPERSEVSLGPATLRFTREPILEKAGGRPEKEDFLEFQFKDSTVTVPFPENVPNKIPLKGTPYQLTILRVLRDAVVEEGKLVGRSLEWRNPACEILLEGKGLREEHTLFEKFPDFPTLHGMRPSQAGVRIYYRRPGGEAPDSKNELRFIAQESGLPRYQVKKGAQVTEGTVRLGEEIVTGWMDFKFRVEAFHPHAGISLRFSEEPVTSQADDHLSAVELEVSESGRQKTFWLGQGDHEAFLWGKDSLQWGYGLKTLPVGFRLQLRDFRIEHYPGTGQPASFESDVTLKDDFTGTVRDVTIRMNQPLKHRGFRVFQSGYQQTEGRPEVSIFTVAKDPGIPVKYAGALILIGGILLMFYSRRFSNPSKGDRSETRSRRGVPARTVPLLAGFLVLTAFSFTQKPSLEEILGRIPVQSGGRVKPFETFAREALLSVAGKPSLGNESATMLVWQWVANPEEWHTRNFIPVSYESLQQEFGLMVIGGKISPEMVLTHTPFQEKVREALEKQEHKQSLSLLEKKRLELYDRARVFQTLARGALPGFFPHPEDPRQGWLPLGALADPEERAFLEAHYAPSELAQIQAALGRLVRALGEEKDGDLTGAAGEFTASLQGLLESRGIVLDQGKIRTELFYNGIHPFQWAWIFYLVSGLLWFFFREGKGDRLLFRGGFIEKVTCPLFLIGFTMHTFGFFLRCHIAGRPPVTNMYESIIWVSWGVVLFSLVLGFIYRNSALPATAAWVAFLGLVIGESFPAVLDPALSPLVPVLRNNYWLTVHVLTITLSYGAFALAWGLAHAVLWSFSFRSGKKEEQEKLSSYLYRALQIGVVLLAAGTILGGVWANESWGRFWGWDPKETWALIALFGYLIVLHGRFAGWLDSFGTAVGSVAAFLGILMAWYGVNFVLGAGLHSYGFGGGGLPYILAVVAFDFVFVSGLVLRYNSRRHSRSFTGSRA